MRGFLYTVCYQGSKYLGRSRSGVLRFSSLFHSLARLSRSPGLNHNLNSQVSRARFKGVQLVTSERCSYDTCPTCQKNAGPMSAGSGHTCSSSQCHTCPKCVSRLSHICLTFKNQTGVVDKTECFHISSSTPKQHACLAFGPELLHTYFSPDFHICLRPLSLKRHFHNSSASQLTCTTGEKLKLYALQRLIPVRFSSVVARHQRIPVSHTEKINEVLAEHAAMIEEFAAVLGCSKKEMAHMVRSETRLVTHYQKQVVITKMKLLLQHGFQPSEILSRPDVFSRSMNRFHSRLAIMEPVKHYRHPLVCLVLSDAQFQSRMAAYRQEVATMGQHSCQASFVAELLECTQQELENLVKLKQYSFLLTLPPSRLQKIVHILQSCGLSVAEMREKYLMLKCPPETAQHRLQLVRDAGVFKPERVYTMLINYDPHFNSSFKRWVLNAKALAKYSNERELLMDRLDCSEEALAELFRRKPKVAIFKADKLKRTLDVLLNEIGLSADSVLKHPQLLCFNHQRLQARWVLLQQLQLSELEVVKDLRLTPQKFADKYS